MERMTDAGAVLATVTALFTTRVVGEQTFLAWARGSKMLDFSSPLSGLDLIGLTCLLLAASWALLAVVLSLVSRSRISGIDLRLIAVILVCCGLWAVPQEQWLLLVVRAHGARHAPQSWVVAAAASDENRLLNYLLVHGANPEARSPAGQSALGAAAAAGDIEAANLLIAHGARLENRTRTSLETPLTEAALMNRAGMVQALLDHGADIGARDATGRTALDWARTNGNAELVGLIRSRSAQ